MGDFDLGVNLFNIALDALSKPAEGLLDCRPLLWVHAMLSSQHASHFGSGQQVRMDKAKAGYCFARRLDPPRHIRKFDVPDYEAQVAMEPMS